MRRAQRRKGTDWFDQWLEPSPSDTGSRRVDDDGYTLAASAAGRIGHASSGTATTTAIKAASAARARGRARRAAATASAAAGAMGGIKILAKAAITPLARCSRRTG